VNAWEWALVIGVGGVLAFLLVIIVIALWD
jgi:hypothetical protein